MRDKAVQRCKEKYPALPSSYEALVQEADKILSDVVVDSRMTHVYNMITG